MMLKEDFVRRMAKDHSMTLEAANKAYKSVFETLGDVIEEHDVVLVHGFGKFEVTTSAARNYKDFTTGKLIAKPERFTVKFRPSEALKKRAR